MMVIYLPVKFEFDWSNCFKVRVRKRKMWTDRRTDGQMDVGHINLIGGLVTRNPPKNVCLMKDTNVTRRSASKNRYKLYPPERKLTKAYQPSPNPEGGVQGKI